MPLRPKAPNVGVEHGAWGEDVAVEYLRVHGYEIVDRNVRPCRRDQRLEIDVIAYDRLILNDAVSYYVSFDNYTVGKLQGEFV